MRHKVFNRCVRLGLGVALPVFLAACGSSVGSDSKLDNTGSGSTLGGLLAKSVELTIPAGTKIPVTLDESISSGQQRSGDKFSATVQAPVVVEGKTIIPKGARATGRIVEARASGRLTTPARLQIALDSVEVQGRSYALDTAALTFNGQNHNKRNLAMIGGGTGAGALIGGIAGGGKGALIGGAVGAGAGTTAAAVTGKKDITLAPETSLSFRLAKPVTVQMKS